MKQRTVVIDLGASKATALAAELSDDGRVVVRAASSAPCKGMRKGSVVDLDEVAQSVEEVLKDVQNEIVEPVETVAVSIGGAQVESLTVQGIQPIFPKTRPITRDDVMQVINHSRRHVLAADREEIQAIPESFAIDGQSGIARPVGMTGSRLEVSTLLVTAQVSQVQNIERAIGKTGRKVNQFILKSLASGLGALTPDQMELGTAIVDIGAGATEVAVFSKGSVVFSICAPIGAALVTSDVSKLLKTSPEEAERLKLKAGHALAEGVSESETVGVLQLGQIHERPLQRRVLCEIVESRMRELATMVRQALEKSGHYGMLPGGVVLTGGGAQLSGAAELFESVLQHHRVSVAKPRIEGKSVVSVDSADMSTAVGMARFALTATGEELSPAGENGTFAGKIRTIWSLIRG